MAHWLFIVTGHKDADEEYTPEEILETRFSDRFWGLGENTPNRRHLAKGDHVVFYMGLPRKEFVGTAVLASNPFPLDEDDLAKYGHNSELYSAPYGVELGELKRWKEPVSVDEIVNQLEFIENKEFWYSYFQGGVRKLNDKDFRVITEGPILSLRDRIASEEGLESESEFALEAHLEEFMARNWSQIDFGANLEVIQLEDQTGRQFPAGQWSIDFLCIDEIAGDLVVMELKRGKSSDSTVGQLLRYIGWVEENIADDGQKVRGIIISREIDDALRYAVRRLSDVKLMTYRVDFHLQARS